jgi:hypothetical protein
MLYEKSQNNNKPRKRRISKHSSRAKCKRKVRHSCGTGQGK